MTQKGMHTWDLILHYHKCPDCGAIIESRDDYQYRLGASIKEVTCPRCRKIFEVTKASKPSFGPLIGDPQPFEMEW